MADHFILHSAGVLPREERSVQFNGTSDNSVNSNLIATTYTLSRDHEGGMVGMGCQEEMVEMESQEAKEKRETLVCKVMYWTGLDTHTHPYLLFDLVSDRGRVQKMWSPYSLAKCIYK